MDIRNILNIISENSTAVKAKQSLTESKVTQKVTESDPNMQVIRTVLDIITENSVVSEGIQIMTPQEFIAKSGKGGDEEPAPAEDEIDEATKLPAQSRELKGQELTDYLDRIRGTADLDKSGKPKLDKKGYEKYVSGKTKSDRYKLPYVHRSSVIDYYDAAGKKYNVDAIKQALAEPPKDLLKQNEKMKHSNGELEQFFNVGFAALVGIALDKETNELIVVNTCPGAGNCKLVCFAMKGGKIQFKGPWLRDGKMLTYVLNDPEGFTQKINAEIAAEEKAGKKGGYKVSIRWHDAGDFFSPEYMDLAFNIARANPDVKFYAYTKMAGAALGNKPDNFIINWSEGAHHAQEKQVKAQDPTLEKTKNSRIVPEDLFYDLLKKDAKGNLDKEGADSKGAGGRWVMRDAAALKQLKQRLAKEYGLKPESIFSYDEYTGKKYPTGEKINVIVAPGEGDISAADTDVLGTLLLKH
jgi:hypothetical protein